MFDMRPMIVAPLLVVGLVAACGSPKDYETEPVKVSTSKGDVTCQLYRRDQVIWDRAIHRPSSMSVAEADNVCIAEGKRQAALS